MFGLAPSAYNQGLALLGFVKQRLGGLKGKRIAIEGVVSAFFDNIIAAIKAQQEPEGFTITGVELVPLGTANFASQAFKIAEAKPDAVIDISAGADEIIHGKALVAAGITVPIAGYMSANSDADVKAINAENWFVARQYPAAEPGTKLYDAASAAGHTAEASSPFFGAGYSSAALLVAAITKCGPGCTPEKLTTTLETFSNWMPPDGAAFGPFNLSPNFHSAPTAIGFNKLNKATGAVEKADVVTFVQKAI
jgi:hypothetical protein